MSGIDDELSIRLKHMDCQVSANIVQSACARTKDIGSFPAEISGRNLTSVIAW